MNKFVFNFEIHNDRASLTCLPEILIQSMRQKGLIPHGSVYVHFCGLITYKNTVAVFFPRNSKISHDSNRAELARNLLKSIQRYKLSTDTSTETADQGTEIIGSESLTLIVSLLDDYILNGLYTRRTKEHSLNQGRTNWKRTINQIMPFVHRNNVLYMDTIGSIKLIDQSSDITRIHAQIIREICIKAGWIAFHDPDIAIHELEPIPPVQESKSIQLNLLTRELNISYSDRDIFLLKNLIQYLNNENGNEQNDFVIGIRECHGFWEKMLDSCLMYKESVNHRFTAPLYKIAGNYELASSRGHRTDTVLKHPSENKYVIADAKYYGAYNIQSAPRLSDIVKQFYYAKAMHLIEAEAEIVVNAFIFPGSAGKIESIHMAQKGQTLPYTEDDCLDEEYPPIKCIYQDPIELIEHYSKHRYLRQLIDKLLALSVDD